MNDIKTKAPSGTTKEAAEKSLRRVRRGLKSAPDIKNKGPIGTTRSRALTPNRAELSFSAACNAHSRFSRIVILVDCLRAGDVIEGCSFSLGPERTIDPVCGRPAAYRQPGQRSAGSDVCGCSGERQVTAS